MESKNFNFKLKHQDNETFNYKSVKGDALEYSKPNNKLTLQLKGDKSKLFDSIRFDEVVIKSGNKKEVSIAAKSYGALLDNGKTVVTFKTL